MPGNGDGIGEPPSHPYFSCTHDNKFGLRCRRKSRLSAEPMMIRRRITADSSARCVTEAPPNTHNSLVVDWRERLVLIVETMREMSSRTDPQKMRRAYSERARRITPADASLSLSRRDLT